jgi:citrate synthase
MLQPTYSKGLEGVIADETSVSLVESEKGELFYRGYPIGQIVERKTFEECVYMVIYGEFPNREQAADFHRQLSAAYNLPDYAEAIIRSLPSSTHPMEAIQSLLAVLGTSKPPDIKIRRIEDPDGTKRSVVEGLDQQRRELIDLLAKIPTIVAYFYRVHQDLEPVAPRPELSLLANFLYMFNGEEPSPEEVRVFEVCQMLQVEHGFNASTLTARVVASTLAPPQASLSAAVGALYGILHGGADEAAFLMARDQIREPARAESFVMETLSRGGRIMGLGHRIYKTVDPRATILKRLAADLIANKGGQKEQIYKTLETVEEVAGRVFSEKGKSIHANVEFYKGAVFNALNIPHLYFTSMFVIARSFGWAAHILELWNDQRLYRPEAMYIGEQGRAVPA